MVSAVGIEFLDTIPPSKPTLAPPSVEPVDITQSILAEAETRKTAPHASQETTVAALQPTIAPNTSNKERSTAAKTSPQTMRYSLFQSGLQFRLITLSLAHNKWHHLLVQPKQPPPLRVIGLSHFQKQQRHEREHLNRLSSIIVRHQKQLLLCRPQQEMRRARNRTQRENVQVR